MMTDMNYWLRRVIRNNDNGSNCDSGNLRIVIVWTFKASDFETKLETKRLMAQRQNEFPEVNMINISIHSPHYPLFLNRFKHK